MSRIKTLLPLLTLVVLLLLPATALAEDLTPDTCLSLDGMCYAADVILDDTYSETDPDGTALGPWLSPRDGSFNNLRNNVAGALQTPGHPYGDGPFFFIAIRCQDAEEEVCESHYFKYNARGDLVDERVYPGVPPEVGVEVPFSYLLGGGVVLGGLLLGVGIVLQRKAKS